MHWRLGNLDLAKCKNNTKPLQPVLSKNFLDLKMHKKPVFSAFNTTAYGQSVSMLIQKKGLATCIALFIE